MSKIYALREWLKIELRKRNMRKVKLEAVENLEVRACALTRSGIIMIEKKWIDRLKLNLLKVIVSHEIDHVQIYRLLRNTPKIEREMQKLLDRELSRNVKALYFSTKR